MKRALAVWFGIILGETVLGILRTIYVEPRIGSFRARQAAVFISSALIVAIACATVRWMGAQRPLAIGALWVALTVAFEIALGRFVANASWERILEDYNLARGGLMPLGLFAMLFAPWLAARYRAIAPPSTM